MHNVFIYYNIGHVSNEKKTKRPPPSEEQIEKAMNEMNNGSSLRKAASNNGINYQTLHNRINSKHEKCNGRPAKLEEFF